MLSLWHISEKVRPCTISLISSFLFFISPFLGFCFHTQTTLNYYFCKSQVFLNCNAFLPSFLYKNRVSVPWFLWIRYQTILPKWKRRLKKSVVYEICKFWASGIHLCTYIHIWSLRAVSTTNFSGRNSFAVLQNSIFQAFKCVFM